MKTTPVPIRGQSIPHTVTWEKLSPTVFRLTFTHTGASDPDTLRVDPEFFNPAAYQEPEYAPLIDAKIIQLLDVSEETAGGLNTVYIGLTPETDQETQVLATSPFASHGGGNQWSFLFTTLNFHSLPEVNRMVAELDDPSHQIPVTDLTREGTSPTASYYHFDPEVTRVSLHTENKRSGFIVTQEALLIIDRSEGSGKPTHELKLPSQLGALIGFDASPYNCTLTFLKKGPR